MKIRKSTTDQVAHKYILEGHGKALYHIWPHERPRDANGKKSNENRYAISFHTVEEAAKHLIDNPSDQIRMQPGHALINQDVIIEVHAPEPAPH